MRILQSYYRWLPKVFPKKLKILKYTYRRVRKSSQEILHSLGAFISFLICNILYITSYLVILLHICIASLQPTGAAKGSNDFAPEVNQSFPPPPTSSKVGKHLHNAFLKCKHIPLPWSIATRLSVQYISFHCDRIL